MGEGYEQKRRHLCDYLNHHSNRCWRGYKELRTLLHCQWECKLVHSLWKTVWWFLKDLEVEISFDPAISSLGIYPKDYKLFYYKDTCIWMFTVAQYYSKDLEPTQMPIDDRLDRENVAHMHHGILGSHRKRWVCVLCRDMDEPGDHHSQQTETRTENEIPHVLTHRQVLNNENTWTQRGEHYTLGSVGRNRRGTVWGGEFERDSMGRNARYRWREEGSKSHCHVCTCATILHVLHMYPKT